MRTLLAALLLLSASEAAAGAWPRDQGTTFVSVGGTVSTGARTVLGAMQDIRSYTSVFAEYGLTPRLTIGLDAGYGTGEDDRVIAGVAFARLPVWSGPGGQRLAAEIGVGFLDEQTSGRHTRIRPGLAWGRGFESRWGAGWLGLDTWAELRPPTNELALKADATAGLKPTDNWMLIMQVQTGRYPDDGPVVRLAPSVVRRLGERMHLQVGATAAVVGDDDFGVKLASWFSF